jgi:hypothetical protein
METVISIAGRRVVFAEMKRVKPTLAVGFRRAGCVALWKWRMSHVCDVLVYFKCECSVFLHYPFFFSNVGFRMYRRFIVQPEILDFQLGPSGFLLVTMTPATLAVKGGTIGR